MSGNALDGRAYPDEDIGDAKTDNDRRKHHHMLELIVHWSALGANEFISREHAVARDYLFPPVARPFGGASSVNLIRMRRWRGCRVFS